MMKFDKKRMKEAMSHKKTAEFINNDPLLAIYRNDLTEEEELGIVTFLLGLGHLLPTKESFPRKKYYQKSQDLMIEKDSSTIRYITNISNKSMKYLMIRNPHMYRYIIKPTDEMKNLELEYSYIPALSMNDFDHKKIKLILAHCHLKEESLKREKEYNPIWSSAAIIQLMKRIIISKRTPLNILKMIEQDTICGTYLQSYFSQNPNYKDTAGYILETIEQEQ